ncbi:MAG: oligosaccharide flippase family protein [Betaproteobacteria bacterium]|nr:oligosaccharide flippase family protein [Betaproteobacteria bacterium]
MLTSSLYLFMSKVLGYGMRLLLPLVLVRLLTVYDFGSYRQFFLLESYIGALFQIGLNQALFYLVPRDVENAGSYFINSIIMNVIAFAVIFAVIGLNLDVLSGFLKMSVLRDEFWVLAAYVITLILTIGCDCFLAARQRVKAAAAFEVGGQILVSGISVMAAYITRDLHTVLVSLVVGRLLQLIGMLAFIQVRLHGFRSSRYFFAIREQIRYSVILGAGGTLITMLARLHEFMVSRYYGTEGFAVYSAGCTEIPIIQMFVQSVAVVALGQFAALEQRNDWAGIRALWRRVMASSYAVTLPVTLVFVLFAKPLVVAMCTSTYEDAAPIFQMNALTKIALIYNYTLVLRAINRNDVTVWVNVATLVVAPFALYGGMVIGGMVGIIAVQVPLMLGTRWVGMIIMNRLIAEPMPFLVSPAEIGGFYAELWRKAKSMGVRLGAGRR